MAKAVQYKYQADPEHYAKMKAYRNSRRRKIQDQILAYKSHKKCALCSEDEPVCLEFHHVDARTKDYEPARLARDKGWGFEKVIAHLEATCIILCSNCHRKIHKQLREKQHKPAARKPRK